MTQQVARTGGPRCRCLHLRFRGCAGGWGVDLIGLALLPALPLLVALALKFSHYDIFRPTADDMAVEKDSDVYWGRMQVRSLAPRYPGKWEYLPLKPRRCAIRSGHLCVSVGSVVPWSWSIL